MVRKNKKVNSNQVQQAQENTHLKSQNDIQLESDLRQEDNFISIHIIIEKNIDKSYRCATLILILPSLEKNLVLKMGINILSIFFFY